MTLLLLIRHATTSSTGVRLAGWTPGIHLSEAGLDQAESLPGRLAGVRLAAIYSSPLERCRETAASLAGERRLDVVVRDGIGEVRYGTWTNRPLKQLSRTKLWRRVQTVPSGVRFPEGESLLEVQARAVAEIERIVAKHPRGAIAVFSHADVIKLLLAHAAGVHADLFQRLVVDPASISVVAVGQGIPRILRMNDTGSLAALSPERERKPNVGG